MIAETDKLIALKDAFRCQIYRCTMSLEACAARQRNAAGGKVSRYKPGSADYNCRDCAQGRENIARLKEQAMDSEQQAKNIIAAVCKEYNIRPADLVVSGKRGKYSTARRKIVYRFEDEIGTLTQAKMAELLGVNEAAIYQILRKRDKAPAPAAPGDLTLRLDFTGHVEVLTAIRRIADQEVRTPEGQVIYWLKKHVRGKEAVNGIK